MVPDSKHFSKSSRIKLSAALQRTGYDIEQAAKMKRKPTTSPFYLHPLQTVSKFLWTMSQSSAALTEAMKTPADVGSSHNTASAVLRRYTEAVEISEVDIDASSSYRKPFLSSISLARSVAVLDDLTADFLVIFESVVSA